MNTILCQVIKSHVVENYLKEIGKNILKKVEKKKLGY